MNDLKALQRRFVEEFQTDAKVDVADELMGIPGTGKEFIVPVMDIVRYRDGQVVEHWNVVDQLPLLQAIGVIPS
jgi:predicted SnoaL-like aldol condensation-catalyzing enzyme